VQRSMVQAQVVRTLLHLNEVACCFQRTVSRSVDQAQVVTYVRLHLSKQPHEAAMWQNL
jgi:hypothetical protein